MELNLLALLVTVVPLVFSSDLFRVDYGYTYFPEANIRDIKGRWVNQFCQSCYIILMIRSFRQSAIKA